jgi:hypothetical protein
MVEALPNYREAHPCLDIFELQAAIWRGEFVCIFCNERGMGVGQLAVLDTTESIVDLAYWLHRPPNSTPHWEARILLPIEPAPNAVHKDRFYWRCPNCKRRRRKLFFKAKWMCADCHGLRFRSQLVSPDVAEYERKEERLGELKAWIGQGRRSRMRHETYQALRKERQNLEQSLAQMVERRASTAHQQFMTGRWERPEHAGGLWLTNWMVKDGKIIPAPDF